MDGILSLVSGAPFDRYRRRAGDGLARIRLNAWEARLVEEEERDVSFVCWLRNPPKQKWSLCIQYSKGTETKPFYPDFLVVRRDMNPNSEYGYVVDVLEPHNESLEDNLAKAQGMAKYAQDERHLGRIQLIRECRGIGGVTAFRRLDLSRGGVRDKVLCATTNEELSHLFETDGI